MGGRTRRRVGARWRGAGLFNLPRGRDPRRLTPPPEGASPRDGFGLTDRGISRARALGEAHYCLICHPRGKDSCAREKNGLGEGLGGCPLEQKISEMHAIWRAGMPLAALATVMADNPLCALTGRRICNACSRGCIFQAQDAVDTPRVETRILEDALGLPWGLELYLLLTRWNPLRFGAPLPRVETGRRVLVAGMGPAGAMLSLGALQLGHAVEAIDGVKIEPLGVPFAPVERFGDLCVDMDERVPAGVWGGDGVWGYGRVGTRIWVWRRVWRWSGGRGFGCGGLRVWGSELTLGDAFGAGIRSCGGVRGIGGAARAGVKRRKRVGAWRADGGGFF